MECVVRITLELFFYFLMEFHMKRLASGSIPVLGSSMKMTEG